MKTNIATDKILIDVQPNQTRIALLSGEQVVELFMERKQASRCVGNIYKARIRNVLPGMQAAFADIGLDKNAYLFVEHEAPKDMEGQFHEDTKTAQFHLQVGDEPMLQVKKDACGTKAASVTQDISVTGRFLVYLPQSAYVGVSRKIEDQRLRDRLCQVVEKFRKPNTGYIIRTAAMSATDKQIQNDANYLHRAYQDICNAFQNSQAPALIYNDGDLIFRTLRDIFDEKVSQVLVNHLESYPYIVSLLHQISPKHKATVTFTTETEDLFATHQLQAQIRQTLCRRVDLHNGAYIVIDKTEALTAIDVNTGKYVGVDNLEETVFLTNMLAAREIAKQVRLRNIGGIIIVDFIDMQNPDNQQQVLQELQTAVKSDRMKCQIIGMSGLGLVEMTRKKTHNDTGSLLMQTCPCCKGDGVIYANDYVVTLLRASLLQSLLHESAAMVTVHPSIEQCLFQKNPYRSELQTFWKDKRIYIVSKSNCHLEEFKVETCSDQILTLPEGSKLLY